MRISDWSSDVCSSDLMSLASMIDATNQYRTAKQKLLNQEMAKINPDLIHKIGDFAQTIIPLATASMTSKAVEELNGQPVWSRIKAVFAEGHTKGELRQLGRASCRERVCQYV